jgi:hypothetical protein
MEPMAQTSSSGDALHMMVAQQVLPLSELSAAFGLVDGFVIDHADGHWAMFLNRRSVKCELTLG